jgi:hypothetical protein
MRRSLRRAGLGGFVALALAVSAIGPCQCLLSTAACHGEAQEADAHACCEKPAGVQAVADECCEIGPELVVASTDVPEVAPPTLQTGHIGHVLPGESSMSVDATQAPAPHPPDRTTVLLI